MRVFKIEIIPDFVKYMVISIRMTLQEGTIEQCMCVCVCMCMSSFLYTLFLYMCIEHTIAYT